MENWQHALGASTTTVDQLVEQFGQEKIDSTAVQKSADSFNLRITPELLRLMKSPDDPLGRQYVPSPDEASVTDGMVDPLAEDSHSPVRNITHRYPDRVLFLVSPVCAAYCRFCMGVEMDSIRQTRLPHLPELGVSPALLETRFGHGCATSSCDATCCAYGVLVDVSQQAEILAHADLVRTFMDPDQHDDPGGWFDNEVRADTDFPSGSAVSTRVRNGACVFLNRAHRCVLHLAAQALGLGTVDLKPFFCRLFPLTLDRGVLMLDPGVRGPAHCCGECPDGKSTVLEVCSAELRLVLGPSGVEELRGLMSRRSCEADVARTPRS